MSAALDFDAALALRAELAAYFRGPRVALDALAPLGAFEPGTGFR